MKKRTQAVKYSFTLIELLVVVAIIAILASILLPALNKARAKARDIECTGRLKNLGQAALMYGADWKGFMPQQRVAGGVSVDAESWPWQLFSYLGYVKYKQPFFHCPNGKIYTGKPVGQSLGYRMNLKVHNNTYNSGKLGLSGFDGRQMVFVDACGPYTETQGSGGIGLPESLIGGANNTANDGTYLSWRHNDQQRVNFACKDGSVKNSAKGLVSSTWWWGEKITWYIRPRTGGGTECYINGGLVRLQ